MIEPICEFGSLQVPGQEGFADIRPLYRNRQFIGTDYRVGPGVDAVLNLHTIGLSDSSVGTVIMYETMEHVEHPYRAVEEAYRVLQPGGMLVMTSLMNFPIHSYPFDYWRFTPEAFKSLLKPFSSVLVDFAGHDVFPHSIIGVAFKEREVDFSALRAELEDWKVRWYHPEAERGWTARRALAMVIPMGVLDIWQYVRGGKRPIVQVLR